MRWRFRHRYVNPLTARRRNMCMRSRLEHKLERQLKHIIKHIIAAAKRKDGKEK